MPKLDDPQTKRRILDSEAAGFERMILKLCPDNVERQDAIAALRQALNSAKFSVGKDGNKKAVI